MAISENTTKTLWGRAAGICSNPSCRADLTVLLNDGRRFNVGEMAHVIARSPGGPRGLERKEGSDDYENLILLCPTCHRLVDKAPGGAYPPEMLLMWKSEHERSIRTLGSALRFKDLPSLKIYVSRLLVENKSLWQTFGPHSEASEDPGSNLHEVWSLRKLDTVVPNNLKIINSIEANVELLDASATTSFHRFKNHALAFEQHQYRRQDSYPTFPTDFEQVMNS